MCVLQMRKDKGCLMLVMISKAEAGLNLGLTIDARITRIMEREMNIAESTYNPDGMIAIAMNLKW